MGNVIYKDCKITDINKNDKTMVVVASDETIDRYSEVMIAKGCKHGDYIPFLWSHNRKEDLPPIGRVFGINKRNNRVKAKIEFADSEFADSINRLYTSDPPMMEKVSVGFITKEDRDPNEDEKKKGIKRVIEKWELLEVSAVPIPANPNAGTERDREMRTKIKDAVDSGEIQLPEMVYKDFGFQEGDIAKRGLDWGEHEPVVPLDSELGKAIIKGELEEKIDVIESNTGTLEWEKVEEILDEGLSLEPEVEEKLLEEVMEKIKETSIEEQKEEEIKESDTEETEDEPTKEVLEDVKKFKESLREFKELEEIEEKPFENYHSCRLEDPKKYPKKRYGKCEQKHNGKCIDVVWGILSPNKSEIQSLRYPKDVWNEAAARSHCKSREGSFEAAKKDVEKQPEKDYLNIVEPEKEIVTFKDSPDIGLENVAQNEGITEEQVDALVNKSLKIQADSLRRAFRKNVLGIVDDK